MKYGERSKEIVMLQDLLKELGLFPLNVDSTGYYGGITQRSVMFFCIKYEVASLTELLSVNGMWCGNKTLKELNKQVKIINEKL
jgi:peptidoglycan hydrolase-like protein with peptidoglycan-binding domain